MKRGLTTALLALVLCPLHVFAADKIKQEKTPWTDFACRALAVGLDVTKLSRHAKAVVLELPKLKAVQGDPANAPHRLITDLESRSWRRALKETVEAVQNRSFYIDPDSNVARVLLDAGYSPSQLTAVVRALTPRLLQEAARIEDKVFAKDAATLDDLSELSVVLAALNDPLGLMAQTEVLARIKAVAAPPESRSVSEITNSVFAGYSWFIPKNISSSLSQEISHEHLFLPGNALSAHDLNLLVGLPVVTIRTQGGADVFSEFLYDLTQATQYSFILFPGPVSVETEAPAPAPFSLEDRYLALAGIYLRAHSAAEGALQLDPRSSSLISAVEGIFYLATHHAKLSLSELPEKFPQSAQTVLSYLQLNLEKTELDLTVPELLALLNDRPEIRSRIGMTEDLTFDDIYDAAVLLAKSGHSPR